MVKTCEICGAEYKVYTHCGRRRFCSRACHQEHRRRQTRVSCQCEVCGRRFEVVAWQKKRSCSRECAVTLRKRRVTKYCEACGQRYEVPWHRRKESRYCSFQCMSTAFTSSQMPTQRQLQHLLVYFTQDQIAEKYNVCSATVRNWCRRLEVVVPNKKERAWLKNLSHWERDKLAEGKELPMPSLPPGRLVKACRPGVVFMPVMSASAATD